MKLTLDELNYILLKVRSSPEFPKYISLQEANSKRLTLTKDQKKEKKALFERLKHLIEEDVNSPIKVLSISKKQYQRTFLKIWKQKDREKFEKLKEGSGRKPVYTESEEKKFVEELKEEFEKKAPNSHMKLIKQIVEKAPPGRLAQMKPKASNGFISRFKKRNKSILGFLDKNSREITNPRASENAASESKSSFISILFSNEEEDNPNFPFFLNNENEKKRGDSQSLDGVSSSLKKMEEESPKSKYNYSRERINFSEPDNEDEISEY